MFFLLACLANAFKSATLRSAAITTVLVRAETNPAVQFVQLDLGRSQK
jgi:hypothetical protein